jgi:hypothetical protein
VMQPHRQFAVRLHRQLVMRLQMWFAILVRRKLV